MNRLRLLSALIVLAVLAIPTGAVLAGPLMQEVGVSVSSAAVTVVEGGATGSYTLVLGTAPTADVTITPSRGTSTDITFSPASLTFTTSNWATAKTVTVTAVEDDIDNEPVTITHSSGSTDTNYGSTLTVGSVTVTITDDDTRGITFSPSPTVGDIIEVAAGDTREDFSYTVRLNSEPTDTVTVTVPNPDTNTLEVSPSTLTFTATTWSTAQTVAFTAIQDDIVYYPTVIYRFRHSISGGDYNNLEADAITLNYKSDDAYGIIFSATAGAIREVAAGATRMDFSYTVRLNSEPTDTVTVTVTNPDTNTLEVSPSALTFTSATWSTAQTVTFMAIQDDIAYFPPLFTSYLTKHDVSGGDYEGFPSSGVEEITLRYNGNDVYGISVPMADQTATIAEGGSATYTIVLDTEPTADVTITPSVVGGDIAFTSTIPLMFTTSNWATAQTVTVTAVDDRIDEGTGEEVTITHTSVSADRIYTTGVPGAFFAKAPDVIVTITDNDTKGITLDPGSLPSMPPAPLGPLIDAVVDEGSSSTYTVMLNSQPTDDVTVIISAPIGHVGLSLTSLMFTDANWNMAQSVRFTAADNDIDQGTLLAVETISHTPSGGGYGDTEAVTLVVQIFEDDVAAFDISATTIDVTEGTTGTINVRLATDPVSSVTLNFTESSSDFNISGTPMTFSTHWNTYQQLIITPIDDDDGRHHRGQSITVEVEATTSDYRDLIVNPITVNILDDDENGVTLSKSVTTLTEGGASDTYTVKLDTNPTGGVLITITFPSTDADQVTVDTNSVMSGNQTALSFNQNSWNTPQSVTVATIDDDIDEADGRMIAILHTATGSAYEGNNATLTVTVDDDDIRGVVVPGESLDVGEDDYSMYELVLMSQPTAAVTVNITSRDTGIATVSPGSVTFSTSNWSTAQAITVTGVDNDIDHLNDLQIMITHAVATTVQSDYTTPSVTAVDDLTIVVVDEDGRKVELSAPDATIAEGATVTYDLTLATEPTHAVTFNYRSTDTSVATIRPGSHTFIPSDWGVAVTLTVTATENDIDHPSNLLAMILHTVAAGMSDYSTDSSFSVDTFDITVTDDDTRGVVVPDDSLNVNENGDSMYDLVLMSQPTAAVTITITSTDTGIATVSPASVTFIPTTWSTAQAITVTGVDNNIDHLDDLRIMITHAIATTVQSDYNTPSVTVVNDLTIVVLDEDGRGVTLSAGNATIAEGATFSYTFVLESEPTHVVTFNFRSDDTSVATIEPPSHTFDPRDWADEIMLTITATQNDIDHPSNLLAMIAHTVADGMSDYSNDSSFSVNTVDITVTDLDDIRGVTLSAASSTDIAEGASATYTIHLDTQPTSGTVTIRLSADHAEAMLSPESVTFTTTNWSSAQQVSVSNPADNYDEDTEPVRVSHRAMGADYESEGVTIDDKDFSLLDDDDRSITVSESAITRNEAATGTYTIVLTSAPEGGDVEIEVKSAKSEDVSVDPSVLTFTEMNWNTRQTIIVTAVDDRIDEEDETIDVTHEVTSSSDYGAPNNVTASKVAVTVNDDDTRGVTITPTILTVPETASREYTVALTSQPTATVTITITDDHAVASEVTITSSSLTFSDSTWETAQTVTVRVADDADSANESAIISHAVAGGDYQAFNADTIDLTLQDNDTDGVVISKSFVSFEQGASEDYTIVLQTQPLTQEPSVTISVTNGAGDNANDVATSLMSVTFTTTNWNTEQTITVTAPVDDDALGETATITHAVSMYGMVTTAATVAVTVTDADIAGVDVSESILNIAEGDTDTYTVRLDTQPVGDNATVTLTNPNTADVTVSARTLTFSATTWNTLQTVTVTAVNDSIDDDGESVGLTHAVAGGDYETGVNVAGVTINIGDDDRRGVTVSESTRTFIEEQTTTYTIVLTSAPQDGGTVRINLSSNNPTKITVTPRLLSFTPSTWRSSRTVTVRAPHDHDTEQDMGIISHRVSGADYGANNVPANSVDITVNDNDTEGVTVSKQTIRFIEGGTETYTIRLQTQPSSRRNQIVTIDIRAETERLTVTPAQITFDSMTWNQEQTITVMAEEDGDDSNEVVNIMHMVTNYGLVMEAADVVATVAEFELQPGLLGPSDIRGTVTSGDITLRWNTPLPNEEGRRPTGYQYRYSPLSPADFGAESASGWITVPGGRVARFVRISGLINQAEYTFQVRAVDIALLAEVDADDDVSTVIEIQLTYIHRTKDC